MWKGKESSGGGRGAFVGKVLMHLWYHTLRVNFWYNAKNISS